MSSGKCFTEDGYKWIINLTKKSLTASATKEMQSNLVLKWSTKNEFHGEKKNRVLEYLGEDIGI